MISHCLHQVCSLPYPRLSLFRFVFLWLLCAVLVTDQETLEENGGEKKKQNWKERDERQVEEEETEADDKH